MPLTIDAKRLTATDLYHFIDWVWDGWTDDEYKVTARLDRLRWHLEELPDLYSSRALVEYETLVRARIVNGVDWRGSLANLRRIVSEWDRARPELKVCGIGGCRIAYRSPDAMLQHRVLVHDAPA